eukprot:scaffold95832_cov63-Phaeocystis_antarctica.AAC.2
MPATLKLYMHPVVEAWRILLPPHGPPSPVPGLPRFGGGEQCGARVAAQRPEVLARHLEGATAQRHLRAEVAVVAHRDQAGEEGVGARVRALHLAEQLVEVLLVHLQIAQLAVHSALDECDVVPVHARPLEALLALGRVAAEGARVLVDVGVELVVDEERLHDSVQRLGHRRRELPIRALPSALRHVERRDHGDSRPDARQPALRRLGRQCDGDLLLHVGKLDLEGHSRAHAWRDGHVIGLAGLGVQDADQIALSHAVGADDVDEHVRAKVAAARH